MESNHKYIEAVNNSTNYSAAAERMIGLGYQELNISNGANPFPASQGKHVRIRLTNYLESDDKNGIGNKAQIEVDGTNVGEPRRSIGDKFSFDFGRYGKDNYKDTVIRYDPPSSNDEDFSGSSPSGGKYYVDMYAVAVGRDTTFTTYYSNVEYLGSVTIDATVENN